MSNRPPGLVYTNTPATPGLHLGATQSTRSSRHHVKPETIIQVELAAIEANPLTVAVRLLTQVEPITELRSREHLVIWQRFISDEARLEWELFEAVFNGLVYRDLSFRANSSDYVNPNVHQHLGDQLIPPIPSIFARWPVLYSNSGGFRDSISLNEPYSDVIATVGDLEVTYDSPLLYTETVQRNLLTGAEIINPRPLESESRRPCSFSRIPFHLARPHHLLSTYLDWPTTSVHPVTRGPVTFHDHKIVGWLVRNGQLKVNLARHNELAVSFTLYSAYGRLKSFTNFKEPLVESDLELFESEDQPSYYSYFELPEFADLKRNMLWACEKINNLDRSDGFTYVERLKLDIRTMLLNFVSLVLADRRAEDLLNLALKRAVAEEGAVALKRQ